jgi:hypothetical protein
MKKQILLAFAIMFTLSLVAPAVVVAVNGNFFNGMPVVVKSVIAFHVVYQPVLVGKPVFKIIQGNWQYIVTGAHTGKISSVSSLSA